MERIEEVVSSSHVEHIFPDQTAVDGGEVRSTPDDAAFRSAQRVLNDLCIGPSEYGTELTGGPPELVQH